MNTTHKLIPHTPTEAMWSGLARSIFLAWDSGANTPAKLLEVLRLSGVTVPDWLRDEPEMRHLDKVLSKGTRAAIIWRAMWEAAPVADNWESDAARVCAAAYQGAGACEWPEEWLDILSDGASGEPLRHDPMSLLPFKLAEVPAQPQQIERLRGLDTEQRVRFYEHDFYVLSNFSAFNLIWRGQTFLNSEAAYHYEKFSFTLPDGTTSNAIQNQVAQDILRAPSAHEAYKVAERNKALRRPDWDAVKFDRMKEILWAKVRQHEYVLRKLMATGDRELVEDSWRDDVWGWGPNRDGENRLGRLWMEIRASIRAGEASIVPLRTDETPIDPPWGEFERWRMVGGVKVYRSAIDYYVD